MTSLRTAGTVVGVVLATATVAVAQFQPAGASTPLATITSMSAHSAPYWGDVPITVHGSGFVGVRQVLVGGRSADWFAVRSANTLVVGEQAHSNGLVHVQVVTAAGRSKVNTAAELLYRNPTGSDPINGGWSVNAAIAVSKRMMATAHQRESVSVVANAARWNAAMGASAVRRAVAWKGMPYSWAGGNLRAPTNGVCSAVDGPAAALDCHIVGFDCSGLSMYAWGPYQPMAHFAATQYRNAGNFHPSPAQLMPGDLLFFGNSAPSIGHVVIYEGNGRTIEARMSGYPVLEDSLTDQLGSWYYGATRPKATGRQGSMPSVRVEETQLSSAGGWVHVSGAGLTDLSAISFGGKLTYDFKPSGTGRYAIKLPPHAAGTVSFSVSNAWGTSTPLRIDYVGAPTVTSLSPSTGPIAGGTTITLRGSGFVPGTTVSVGRYPAAVTVLNSTTLTLRTPAQAAGRVTLVLRSRFGSSTTRQTFLYTAPTPVAPAPPATAGH